MKSKVAEYLFVKKYIKLIKRLFMIYITLEDGIMTTEERNTHYISLRNIADIPKGKWEAKK